MKAGMQREIVVAYWLLFDEFEIGEDDPPRPPVADHPEPAAGKPTAPVRPPRRSNRSS